MKRNDFFFAIVIFIIFLISILFVSKNLIISAFISLESCDNNESCVRYCCPSVDSCKNESKFNKNGLRNADDLADNFKALKGLPCFSFHETEIFTFAKNGYLIDVNNHIYQWNEYCYYFDDDEGIALVCVPHQIVENLKELYPCLMMLSLIMLIAILVIDKFLELIVIKHGNFIICYVLSLTLMYFVLIMISLVHQQMLENYTNMCKTLGYLFLTFIFMCFLWLTVMCFDVWFTVRNIKNGFESKIKFHHYCMFAFGLPIVTVLLVLILNESGIIPEGWRTNIGEHSCTISEPLFDSSDEASLHSQRAQFIYLYGPISLFLFINLGFYGATFYTLYKEKRLSDSDEQLHRLITEREIPRLNLYAWFCLFMTIIWTIEILSWLIENSSFLYVLSIINCLQGAIIFYVLVIRNMKFSDSPVNNNDFAMLNKMDDE